VTLAGPRAWIGLAWAQLTADRTRTVLAVGGIALAVLAAVLLASVGLGVIETGEQKFDAAGRDLWVTGGPLEFAPGTVGGVENGLVEAHTVAAELRGRDDISTARALAFQTVYVSPNRSSFETVIGVGGPANSGARIQSGHGFTRYDQHYANGTYNGTMTHQVVIDPRLADRYGVGVNDTLYIGGTLASARQHEFRIVGTSGAYAQFLGSPVVVLHLSELQTITGTTGSDRATMIPVRLADGAQPTRVAADIERAHPAYEVRTNREQLRQTVRRQAVVLAAGASLILLAVLAGAALTVNLLLSVVAQQRRTFAALKALGLSTGTLAGIITVQALMLGVVGGMVGLLVAVPAVQGLNAVVSRVVGFEGVVSVVPWVFAAGFGLAVVMAIVAAVAAAWRVRGLEPLAVLSG
jgi:putative ABC transport system permease protein